MGSPCKSSYRDTRSYRFLCDGVAVLYELFEMVLQDSDIIVCVADNLVHFTLQRCRLVRVCMLYPIPEHAHPSRPGLFEQFGS